MPILRVIYTENGKDYPLSVILSASMPSPLVDGALTIQGVVAIVDSVVTGIAR